MKKIILILIVFALSISQVFGTSSTGTSSTGISDSTAFFIYSLAEAFKNAMENADNINKNSNSQVSGSSNSNSTTVSEPGVKKTGIQVYDNPDNPDTALVEIYGPGGASFTYTTNGTKATPESIPYTEKIVLPLGTTINVCTKKAGKISNDKFTISRSEPKYPYVFDNATLGSGIKFDNDGTIFYFIEYNEEPVDLLTYYYDAESSAYIKEQPIWTEYSGPIYFKDLDCTYFTIYYTYFSNENAATELSSLVFSTSYHIYEGAAFTLIFYDKGYYSDGWRYLEACPYCLGKAKWGANNTITRVTTSKIGTGYENTNKLYNYIGDVDYTLQSTVYAAKLAVQSCYGGKTDWYIPSKDEMELLHENCSDLFGVFTDYWTSTEKDSTKAYTYLGSAKKTKELKSLLIRRF